MSDNNQTKKEKVTQEDLWLAAEIAAEKKAMGIEEEDEDDEDEDKMSNNDRRVPRYISLNYDYQPLPKVEISDDYENWTRITDAQECLKLLKGKDEDYNRYLQCYKDYLAGNRL